MMKTLLTTVAPAALLSAFTLTPLSPAADRPPAAYQRTPPASSGAWFVDWTTRSIIYIPFAAAPAPGFDPVNASVGSLRELGISLATLADSSGVQDGQTLTVNGQAAGSYHYRIIVGNTTISSFSNNDYFSTEQDTDWEVLVVVGNLTISAAIIPTARKLGLFIYCTGTLTINNSISMSARGANHSSGTGSNLAAAAIRIADGTYSSVTNPEVPAAGGGGGNNRTSVGNGNPGSAGTGGGTGGGGGGGRDTTEGGGAGGGAAGTSFTGGSAAGGKGGTGGTSGYGQGNGGPGGDGDGDSGDPGGGGAGNPGGALSGTGSAPGGDGTGGILVIVATTLAGSGTITANGVDGGGGGNGGGGGGSGGGSITILYGTDSSSITPAANGGAGGTATRTGGAGGLGTARKLAIP